MNKKIFFAATVAAAALTACTSEEALESVANKPASIEASEIVGAKLASAGISVVADNGEAATRVNASGWEKTDKISLAWINNGSTSITAYQGASLAGSGYSKEIYANIILSTSDHGNTFNTLANVYEGAYFVYSPWEYVAQAGIKQIAPNKDVQKADVNTERYNRLPWISGLKFISAADNDLENGNLTTSFSLSPIANALRVSTTLDKDGKVAAALGNYSITLMDIYNATNASFAPAFTLDPNDLPENGASTEVMDAKIKAIADAATHQQNIVTNIDREYGKISKGANEFRSFILPTMDVTGPQDVYFFLHVTDAELGMIGQFKIGSASAKNAATVSKLDKALREPEALYAKSITQILRNDEGKAAALGLPITLDPADFELTMADEVSNLAEWNTVVNVWEKLGKPGVLNITLDDEVEFDGPINVPTNGVKVNKGTSPKSKLSLKEGVKNVALPENFYGDPAGYPSFMVKKGAQLIVATDCDNAENLIAFGTEAGTVPGEIVLTTVDSKVNMELANNGLITIKQGAAQNSTATEPAKAATVVNATGTIKYMIDEYDCNDKDLISAVCANANITTVVIAGKTLTTNTNLREIEVTAKNSAIVASVLNVQTQNVKFNGTDAELTVTVGKDGVAGTYTIEGTAATVSGNGKLTVNGKGSLTKTGAVNVASETTLVVESGVSNLL